MSSEWAENYIHLPFRTLYDAFRLGGRTLRCNHHSCRRSLFKVSQGLRRDTVESLVCDWCSRRFAYRETAIANEISWHNPAMIVRSSDHAGAVAYDILAAPRDAVASNYCMDSHINNMEYVIPMVHIFHNVKKHFEDMNTMFLSLTAMSTSYVVPKVGIVRRYM